MFALQQDVLHRFAPFARLELVDYARLPGWWFAALAGGAAELSELPNSFVERRLRIPPGEAARGALGMLFFPRRNASDCTLIAV